MGHFVAKKNQPLSIKHANPSIVKIAFSRLAIVATVVFWALYMLSTILRQFIEGPASYHFTMEAYGYSFVVTLLTFSALMYLLARQGALIRFSKHLRVPRSKLESFFSKHQPSITILVPSYSEETDVIRKTLLSAALQEYPNLQIVLLLDDDPNPEDKQVLAKLTATRNLAKEIEQLLHTPLSYAKKALLTYRKKYKNSKQSDNRNIAVLAKEYNLAASWLIKLSKQEKQLDHVDKFFAEQVLEELANDLSNTALALEAAAKDKVTIASIRIEELYQRLVWIFDCQISVFERKQYASLSKEANKAMNLNSYISLMGGKYKEQDTPYGNILIPVATKKNASLIIPDSDFVLTLDADSILLREYCLRLTYFLSQRENSKVAICQTPYSAFPHASSPIERISGATTDIQHILHQGLSHYGAAFWVGANALIRKSALLDIARQETIGDFVVTRYIQDHTVIEDTESSVDLAISTWQIVNYPERLSYSATPPDFGSLIIQRRRWANGGLLILPKLWSHISSGKVEFLLRLNYMTSIAWSTFGLLFLLAYPYNGLLLSPLVLLAAVPYFLAMANDLKYSGYNALDIFRIYGFNLILLPVNLAGVLKSLEQAITGKKIPFARTPKVKNRTTVPPLYLLSPLLIIGFSVFTLIRNYEAANWGNAMFALINATTATWALLSYVGIRALLIDLALGYINFFYVEVKPPKAKAVKYAPPLNWRSVLHYGADHLELGGQRRPHRELLPSQKIVKYKTS